MLVYFVFTVVGTITAIVLLIEMYRRDNPLLGAWAHVWLCLGGIAGAAYGIMNSSA